jgi:hypothetical protein
MSLQQIADAAKRVDTLQKNLHDAEQLISLAQSATVVTGIEVGAYLIVSEGGNNWSCEPFDEALSDVVQAHLPDLAREALARMAQQYHAALIAEKDHLKGVLEEVERAEEQAARANPYSEANEQRCNPEPSHA